MREEIFYTNKDIKDTKIAIIADIHYSPTFKDKILDNIAKQINTAKPDYLIIAGDILDRSNYEYQKIIDFLKNIRQIATVIITIGNHDTYVKSSNGKVVNGINEDFINKIKQINNTYILRDEKIIIDNICFYGFDLSFYHFIKDKESYSSFCQEIPNLKTKLDTEKVNLEKLNKDLEQKQNEIKQIESKINSASKANSNSSNISSFSKTIGSTSTSRRKMYDLS